MNLIDTFQDLVSRVPELVQPLIVALAGAVPFIEGEGAAVIGIVGGIHPVLAVVAAIVGNFVCVALLVLLGSGARRAVVTRYGTGSPARAGAPGAAGSALESAAAGAEGDRGSARRAKFQRAFERYGVPGVSLLGPLLLPTQFTATMLATAGVGKARILIWQAIAIVGWTTILAVLVGGVVRAAG
ncbi:small multidrug efflux protein [Leucobacter allii]|uniref:small multidrug efflux protein n=1 Tax=Leucobacter allii TaxID=2932247 RepID=UPI001FCFE125|nr:small multidrug efflux protein [Leucobacter allii]UOR00903.1 small multidrug efflux protein [Leucobacter allii]